MGSVVVVWTIQCKWSDEALRDWSRQLVPNIPEWHNASWNYGYSRYHEMIEGTWETVEAAVEHMCSHSWHRDVHVRVFNVVTGEVVPGDLFDLKRTPT